MYGYISYMIIHIYEYLYMFIYIYICMFMHEQFFTRIYVIKNVFYINEIFLSNEEQWNLLNKYENNGKFVLPCMYEKKESFPNKVSTSYR